MSCTGLPMFTGQVMAQNQDSFQIICMHQLQRQMQILLGGGQMQILWGGGQMQILCWGGVCNVCRAFLT